MTRDRGTWRMRLAKYLAHAGVASRRAAESRRAGRVRVDGRAVATPPAMSTSATASSVDGQPLGGAEARVVYALQQAARRGLHRARHPRAPDVVALLADERRACTRSGASTLTAAG